MNDDTTALAQAVADALAQRMGPGRLIGMSEPAPTSPVDLAGPLARTWRDGDIYETGAVASWGGGLWQARNRTAQRPPGRIGEWLLLADGLRAVHAYQEGADPRAFGVVVSFASGSQVDLPFRMPLPLHRGPYQERALYNQGDEVEWNGQTFRAIHNAPGAPDGDGWLLVSGRGLQGEQGPQGVPGERGERGEIGPQGQPGPPGATGQRGLGGAAGNGIRTVEQVPGYPSVIRIVLEDGTVTPPIDIAGLRFVGVYKPGSAYQKGDVVRLSYHLWVALEPTEDVPSHNSPVWAIFLTGQDPSGTGGGLGSGGGGGGNFLPLSGGALTGFLFLHAPPTDAAHAASKAYVDAMAAGAPRLIGIMDASNGICIFLPTAGLPDGELPDADPALIRTYVIVVTAGTPPIGPIRVAFNVGDYAYCDGVDWARIPIGGSGGGISAGEADLRYLQLTGGRITGNLDITGAVDCGSFRTSGNFVAQGMLAQGGIVGSSGAGANTDPSIFCYDAVTGVGTGFWHDIPTDTFTIGRIDTSGNPLFTYARITPDSMVHVSGMEIADPAGVRFTAGGAAGNLGFRFEWNVPVGNHVQLHIANAVNHTIAWMSDLAPFGSMNAATGHCIFRPGAADEDGPLSDGPLPDPSSGLFEGQHVIVVTAGTPPAGPIRELLRVGDHVACHDGQWVRLAVGGNFVADAIGLKQTVFDQTDVQSALEHSEQQILAMTARIASLETALAERGTRR